MDEKKIFSIAIVLIIFAGLALGGYYFYFSNRRSAENTPSTSEGDNLNALPAAEGESGDNCAQIVNVIIDGDFEKIENELLYLFPREDSEQINIVRLTDKTEFFKMNLSQEMEVLSQTETDLGEFKEGDNISVVARCDSVNSTQKSALIVKKVLVETEGEPAPTE